ncbi:MAG: LURP-one-related family protein [Lachnospiraceae bacterium]|nr:LURP-one-related family protein [Lachnospiraceae bacterium]
MKLFIKQRAFTWFDSYNVFDEDGNVIYTIKGELSWGHCLRIYDTQNNEVGMIKEKRDTLLPKFEMYVDGNYIGSISKEFSDFKTTYNIDFNGWHIEGDVPEWEYQIYNAVGYQIADISKEVLNWTDAYRIKSTNPQDDLYALMLIVAIDAEKNS